MRILRFGFWVLSCLFVIAGCGGEKQTANTNVVEGDPGGVISVHVSDGDPITRPFYTWSSITSEGVSDITAYKVTVARASDTGVPVWEVLSVMLQDDIRSGVTHGEPPLNGAETAIDNPEIDLQTDISYRVTVTKADITTTGYREFLIKP